MIETRVERFAATGTRIEQHLFGTGDAGVLLATRRAIEAMDDALTFTDAYPKTPITA